MYRFLRTHGVTFILVWLLCIVEVAAARWWNHGAQIAARRCCVLFDHVCVHGYYLELVVWVRSLLVLVDTIFAFAFIFRKL